jgi:peptide deformylase
MNLVKDGHPVLHVSASLVEAGDLQIPELIAQMKNVCIREGGVGLAANQLGVTKQVIYIRTQKTKMAMINPVILKTKGKLKPSHEGCLSFPGETYRVMRYNTIIDHLHAITLPVREFLDGKV